MFSFKWLFLFITKRVVKSQRLIHKINLKLKTVKYLIGNEIF